MTDYIKFFEKYVKSFDLTDKNIKIKYEHSLKVYQNSVHFIKNHRFTERENHIIKFISLFHDLGRFKQLTKYKTYNDNESIDHGKLSVDILLEYNLLTEFDEEEKRCIIKSIFNHNKPIIENGLTDKELFYSKVIRDLDKLDIYRVYFKYYDKKNKKIKTIKQNFFNSILDNKYINYNEITENIDFVFIKLSWVYDLNFQYTKNKIIENRYLQRLFNKISNNEMKTKLQEKVLDKLYS